MLQASIHLRLLGVERDREAVTCPSVVMLREGIIGVRITPGQHTMGLLGG